MSDHPDLPLWATWFECMQFIAGRRATRVEVLMSAAMRTPAETSSTDAIFLMHQNR